MLLRCHLAILKDNVKLKVTWIYIAPSRETPKALRHGSQFYLQTTPCLPPPRKRSPDGATIDCSHRHLFAAYYSFIDPKSMKGWIGLVGWSPISCRSSAGQGKFAGHRPTFYHCATQPTNAIADLSWTFHATAATVFRSVGVVITSLYRIASVCPGNL